jgi:hypothetical protein
MGVSHVGVLPQYEKHVSPSPCEGPDEQSESIWQGCRHKVPIELHPPSAVNEYAARHLSPVKQSLSFEHEIPSTPEVTSPQPAA